MPEINIEFLRAEDIENFGKFIDQALSKEAHQEYLRKNNFFHETKSNEEKSRGSLSGYINNQVMYPENQKWYDPKNYQAMVELGMAEEDKK